MSSFQDREQFDRRYSPPRGPARPLAVLDLLAQQPGLTAKVVSRLTGIPKSSTHHLLNTLHAWNFTEYDADAQTWSLGPWVTQAADASTSIKQGLTVLEQFDRRRQTMTATTLSKATGLPSSQINRVIRELERLRYLAPASDGGYSLGFGVIALASRVARIERLRETARPFLFYLRDQTNETANLLIRDHDSALYVDQVESTKLLNVSGWAGRVVPLDGTASGAALTSEDTVHVRSWPDDEVTAVACRIPGTTDPPAALSITAPNSRLDQKARQFCTVAVSDAAAGIAGQMFQGK